MIAMKHSKVFVLFFISFVGPVYAANLTIYYDTSEKKCPDYCNFPHNGDGCCPAANVVTPEAIYEKFASVAAKRDEQFSGFKLPDNTEFMDKDGNIKMTGAQVASKGLANTGITLRTVNTCTTGEKNSKGVCYDSAGTYVDLENGKFDDGFEVSGQSLDRKGKSSGNGGKGTCEYDRDFDVVIHWAPRDYEDIVTTPYDYVSGLGSEIHINQKPISWTGIPKKEPSVTYHYHWDGGLNPGKWTKNGTPVKQIQLPTVSGWTLRGLYVLNYPLSEKASEPKASATDGEKQAWINYLSWVRTVADELVSEATNTYSTARIGFLPNQIDLGYIDVEDDGAYGNSQTRWSIWTCEPIDEIHMYAGWTRNCANDMCHLTIKRNGLNNNNNRGDVFYDVDGATCLDGSIPKNRNTYKPSCENASETIDYTYAKYRDAVTGESVSCKGFPEGNSCQRGGSFELATPTSLTCGGDGANYKLYKWMPQDNLPRDPGEAIDCSAEVLGTTPANISGHG